MKLRDARSMLRVFSLAWIAAAWLAGCASHVELGTNPPLAPAVGGSGVVRFTPAERDFAMQAAIKGLYDVEVSRLAAARAVNPLVRNFAQDMVVRHTQLNGELVAIMNARGIAPPHSLPDDKAAKLQRLASVPPSDAFDNGYVRVVGIEEQQEAIAAFETARAQVSDPELRAWIDRTLPILRSHLSTAQVLSSTLTG